MIFIALAHHRVRVTPSASTIIAMGLNYRKKVRTGKDSWLNLSGSGVSGSKKVGPLTINSRGGLWVKLPGGFTYRGRWK